MLNQTERLYNLLSDMTPHSTIEIVDKVYGNGMTLARVGARIFDLKLKYNKKVKGWKDAHNPAIYWYQLTDERIEDKQKRFTDMQYKLGLQHHVNQVAVRLASNSEEKTVMTAVIQGMLYRMEKDGIIKIL